MVCRAIVLLALAYLVVVCQALRLPVAGRVVSPAGNQPRHYKPEAVKRQMFNINSTEPVVGGETSDNNDESSASSKAVVPNSASDHEHSDSVSGGDKIATTIDQLTSEISEVLGSSESNPFSSVELPESVPPSVVPSSVPDTPESEEHTPASVPPPSSTWVASVLPSTSQIPTSNKLSSSANGASSKPEGSTGTDEIVYETSTHWRDAGNPQSSAASHSSNAVNSKVNSVVSSSEKPQSPGLSTIHQTSEHILSSQLTKRESSTSEFSKRESTSESSSKLGSTSSQSSKRESTSSQASSQVASSKSSSPVDDILSDIDSAFSGLLGSISSSKPVTLTPTSSGSVTPSGPSATPSSVTRHRHSASSKIAETDASKSSSNLFPWLGKSSSSSSASSAPRSEKRSDSFFSIIRSSFVPEPSSSATSAVSSGSSASASSTETATPASVVPPKSSSGSSAKAKSTASVSGSGVSAASSASASGISSGAVSGSGSTVTPASSATTQKPLIPTASSFWSSVFAPHNTPSSSVVSSGVASSGVVASSAATSGPVASVASSPSAPISGSSSSRVIVPPISSGSSVPLSSLFGTTTLSAGPSMLPSGVSSGFPGASSVATQSGASSGVSQYPWATKSSSGSAPVSVPTSLVASGVSSAVRPGVSSGSISSVRSASRPIITPSASASASASGVSSFGGLRSAASSSASASAPVVIKTHSSRPVSSYKTVSPSPTATPSTSDWLPDLIITQTAPTVSAVSGSSENPAASASTTPASSVPSSLPKAIAPSSGPSEPPKDAQLIQIGFDKPLNYPFVVEHPLAVAQIFRNLPMGIGYGLTVDKSNVSMVSVQPYQSDSADYLVTVALAYIPKKYVDTLDALIHTPSSQLYKNPNQGVASLMNLIDPTIPLIPGGSGSSSSSGNSGSQSGSGSSGNGSSGNGSGNGNGNDDGGDSGSSSGSLDQTAPESKVNTKTVGIAVGAIAGAAAYVGAIFFVAKRYRQKRSSLVLEGSDEGSIGSRFFDDQSITSDNSGMRSNNSSRQGGSIPIGQQPISKPVMSENSLGWA